MKKKYLCEIIIIIVIILVLVSNHILKKETKEEILADSLNIINQDYHSPIIESVFQNDDTMVVNAFIYRYGDVNRSGKIDKYDYDTINYILLGYFSYEDNELLLGDLNKNNKIDQEDLNLLNTYLKEHEITLYKLENDEIEYCGLKNNDLNLCKWQKNNTFNLDEDMHYFYAKYHEKISNAYFYEKLET